MLTILKKNSSVYPWFLAIRPRTMSIPTVQVIAALALAYSEKRELSLEMGVVCLLIGLFITIATNLFNDAIDHVHEKGPIRSFGFQKVLREKLLTPKQIYYGAFFCLFTVTLLSIPLILRGGQMISLLILLSLFCSYFYTGTSFAISYNGLSEIFILLFYGFICMGITFFVQTNALSLPILLASFQLGLLAIVPNALNNFRDIEEDRNIKKKTLAVRFGTTFCRWELAFLLICPFILSFFWKAYGYQWAAVLPLLALPLALRLIYLLFKTNPGPIFNRFFRMSALVHLLFAILLSIGFIA